MRHALVRSLLVYYLERLGYPGRVRVFTRREPFDRLCRKRKVGGLSEGERTSYAVTLHGRVPATWVNVDAHRTIAQLSDTAAHEACHISDGGTTTCSSRTFVRRVRALRRGSVDSK